MYSIRIKKGYSITQLIKYDALIFAEIGKERVKSNWLNL